MLCTVLQVGHLRAELQGQSMIIIGQHKSRMWSQYLPPPQKKGLEADTFSNSAGKLNIMGESLWKMGPYNFWGGRKGEVRIPDLPSKSANAYWWRQWLNSRFGPRSLIKVPSKVKTMAGLWSVKIKELQNPRLVKNSQFARTRRYTYDNPKKKEKDGED